MGLTNALVTGGAGFLGSHVTAELPRPGSAVRVLCNVFTGSRANLAAVRGDLGLLGSACSVAQPPGTILAEC